MIIDPPIKSLSEKVDCRYTLAMVAAKRARQIVNGSEPMLGQKEDKPVSVALKELEANLVGYRRSGGDEI